MLSKNQFAAVAAETPPGAGATVDPHTGQFHHEGWAVATPGHEQVIPSHEYGGETLERYTRAHVGALSAPGRNLGIWHQPGEGAYLDVSQVHPETYRGGVQAISQAYHGARGLSGEKEQSIYRMSKGHTLYTAPGDAGEHQETRQAMGALRKQRGGEGTVAGMGTGALRAALRGRR